MRQKLCRTFIFHFCCIKNLHCQLSERFEWRSTVSELANIDRAAENLGDAAYRQMKERIIRGVYRPGHKLTVRAVAQDLDVEY